MNKNTYSRSPDCSLHKDTLSVYLPVSPETKDLIQEMWDLKRPTIEFWDQDTFIAAEWEFESGPAVLKKLQKKTKWQQVFK